MGIEPDAPSTTVRTLSRLTGPEGSWAELDGVPVFNNLIRVRHDGSRKTAFTNISGQAIFWDACFYSEKSAVSVNGVARQGRMGTDSNGRSIVRYRTRVLPGERCEITVR
jgi:hypothetical protein